MAALSPSTALKAKCSTVWGSRKGSKHVQSSGAQLRRCLTRPNGGVRCCAAAVSTSEPSEPRKVASPVFQTFAEALSGDWKGYTRTFDGDGGGGVPEAKPSSHVVEEVWRPCGGNIMGVSDTPSSNPKCAVNARRSDAGTVVYEDGCYSVGPPVLSAEERTAITQVLVAPAEDGGHLRLKVVHIVESGRVAVIRVTLQARGCDVGSSEEDAANVGAGRRPLGDTTKEVAMRCMPKPPFDAASANASSSAALAWDPARVQFDVSEHSGEAGGPFPLLADLPGGVSVTAGECAAGADDGEIAIAVRWVVPGSNNVIGMSRTYTAGGVLAEVAYSCLYNTKDQ